MCDLMDYKDCRHLCKNEINDYEVEKLWEDFEDVLFIEDKNSDDSCSLVLSDDWQGWNKGTTRDTIWHWFDEHHSKGIHWLLYGTEQTQNQEFIKKRRLKLWQIIWQQQEQIISE